MNLAQTAEPSRPLTGDATAGTCRCGCGQPTRMASKSCTRRGWVKGKPLRYLHGHGGRDDVPPPVREEDHGYHTPCWVWQRAKSERGYGLVKINGVTQGAHRAFYERHIGPIPVDLELDHLCRVRACVNPAHLEPVTHPENVQRGVPYRPPRSITSRNFMIHVALATTDMSFGDVAEMVGVSPSFVGLVRRGERVNLTRFNERMSYAESVS